MHQTAAQDDVLGLQLQKGVLLGVWLLALHVCIGQESN